MPTEQAPQSGEAAEPLDDQPRVVTEPGYGGKLRAEGYKIAGVGTIAFSPELAIPEGADIEAILVAAAERSYADSELASAASCSTAAKHTLEVYREVISQYGADRVIITVRTDEAQLWQHLLFNVKPMEGEHIDVVEVQREKATDGERQATDEGPIEIPAGQTQTVSEGRDLNLSHHEAGDAS